MAQSLDIHTMHGEHREWSSDISHWERELAFLENLTKKVQDKEVSDSLHKAAGELQNRIYHHKTLLKHLKDQIQSHEAFIRDQLEEAFEVAEESGLGDHHKTRHHMRDFKESFKELKHEIFQLCEETL